METSDLILLNTGKLFSDTAIYDLPRGKPSTHQTPFNEMLFNEFPGMRNYYLFASKFTTNLAFVDRSNTLTTPFNVKLLPSMEMPVFEKVHYNYWDLVNERAKQILNSTDKDIVLLYGGGVDSLTVLNALEKNSDGRRIKIALSEESVYADRYYFESYIKDKYELFPSVFFNHFLGDKKYVCVTGEGNDELFGTNFINRIVYRRGNDFLSKEPSEDNLLFLINVKDKFGFRADEDAERNLNYLLEIAKKSPVDLETIHQFFWWINFCLSWNTKQTRLLAFAERARLEENLFHFFSTKEFQLWSMNKAGSFWKKKEAKEYIGLGDLLDQKAKVNNLNSICYNKRMAFTIDSSMKQIHSVDEIDSTKFLLQDNSFL